MKKHSAISIMVLLLLVFSGCTMQEPQKLTGTWKYDCDISALLNDADEKAYFNLEPHNAELVITFNADNTYTFGFDDTSLQTALEEIRTELAAESEDYIRKVIADQGSVYQYFAESLVQELREETEEEFSVMVEELYAQLSVTKSGSFVAEGNKLYWDNETDEYDIYTLAENTLTLDKDIETEKDELYPMIFTKVK